MLVLATAAAAVMWLAVLLVPWHPWSTAEQLDATEPSSPVDLSEITVLIPARDEAAVIGTTVAALRAQGPGLRIVVIDDQSTDGTADLARAAGAEVIPGAPLGAGWVGKLWALEQGRRVVRTPITLLVDADIELRPGLVPALLARRAADGRQLVSLMAVLETRTVWERLLIPAFVYFFKLLYPFRLANSANRIVAAAAGGCVLVDTLMLERIGGFGSLRDALIDDCALARRVKDAGGRTWVGLTHSAISLRRMPTLGAIWDMVARSAFAQLRFSTVLLAVCIALLVLAFWIPPIGLFVPTARWYAVVALVAMMASYVPLLRYYGHSPAWALTLPLAGTLYLLMTISSAVRAWRGVRSRWKGRAYR